jgi:4-hydroxy-3-methylbut-2-enyl diphosphate reductase
MKVLLANPRGFCAGVERAIEIVERALEKHGPPIYVRHEVVHNKHVVNDLKNKGVVFVDEINKIPKGSVVIFFFFSVSKKVRNQAKLMTLTIYDAPCPLVTKVHKEVVRRQKQKYQVILIGHKNHPEVEGTLGQSADSNSISLVESIKDLETLDYQLETRLSYTSQTTLSVDDTMLLVEALETKFPWIQAPKKNDICYATQNRQDSVKAIIEDAEALLVIGSKNSSNSNRLKEIAEKKQKPAYLIDGPDDINSEWLAGISSVGVTAGASAPEVLVQGVVNYLIDNGAKEVFEYNGSNESMHFPVPSALK